MKILILGICGKMGLAIYNAVKDLNLTIEGLDLKDMNDVKIHHSINEIKITDYDLLVDFSQSTIAKDIIPLFIDSGINVISGTTNLSKAWIKKMSVKANKNHSKFIHKDNFASGFEAYKDSVSLLKKSFDNYEIIESHDISKLDMPSGSAKILANILNVNEAKIKSLRANEVTPMHMVILSNKYEKVVICHQILSRDAFLEGFMEIFRQVVGELC